MMSLRGRGLAIALACALIMTGCGGGGGTSSDGGSSSPPPPPVSTTAVTSLKLTSDPGDFVGAGSSYSYSQANAAFTVTTQGRRLIVQVLAEEKWYGDFEMPSGYSALATGTYNNLTYYPLHDPIIGGLRWTSDGRTCGGVAGSVTIRKVVYEGDTLTELDMQFTQYCDGMSYALRGDLRWNAKDATKPPGPTAPPAGLWQPPAGATPATGSYIYLESQPGDYIGAGGTYLYTQANSSMGFSAQDGNVGVFVAGDYFWDGTFQGMSTLSQLEPGYYGNLRWYPSHNPAVGGLQWSGNNRTCGGSIGWFVVDSITYTNGYLNAVEIRFEQRCVYSTGVLRGKFRWVPGDTAQPPGPAPIPEGLWQPPAGSTPATGNYVYFETPAGIQAESGKTFLYTQANAILSTRNLSPGLVVEIAGDKSWTLQFEGMSWINQLQVGYYGNLQLPPFHNPTIGAIKISTANYGCGTGWFVVDAVEWDGSTLKSIDMRFEMTCGLPGALLHGKLHWSDSDTTVPPGPVAPPAGLWAPGPGATPDSGTFAYFESTIDATLPTRTFLYTPNDATFLIDASGALLLARVISGTTSFTGELQGMNSISRFEPGYYGGLQGYPRNATKGGMDWFGSAVGACEMVSGWFVVDSVTYQGSTLTSIDLRFEKQCLGSSLLRGRLRWSP